MVIERVYGLDIMKAVKFQNKEIIRTVKNMANGLDIMKMARFQNKEIIRMDKEMAHT